jgi:hypothetical protein
MAKPPSTAESIKLLTEAGHRNFRRTDMLQTAFERQGGEIAALRAALGAVLAGLEPERQQEIAAHLEEIRPHAAENLKSEVALDGFDKAAEFLKACLKR